MHHRQGHVPDVRNVEILTGEPKKAIRYLFVPILISLAVSQLNIFIDNIWCSSLGVEAASALAVVATIYYFFTHSAAGLGIGLNVAVANRIGAGDREGADSRCVQMLVLVSVISVMIIPLCFIFMDDLITVIGGDVIRDLCRQYLEPMFLLSTFIMLSPLLSGMLSGEGAAKKATTMNIVCALTNIILDPLFIFGFGMGVAGASLATGLACVASVGVALWYYCSGKTYVRIAIRKFRIVRDELKDVLYVAVPQMLEQNVGSVANLLLVIFIVGCGGSVGLSMYNLPWKVVHLIMVPASAFASAMIPVLSAARGLNDPEKMRVAYRYGLKTVTASGIIASVFVFVFAYYIMFLFCNTGDMIGYRDELTMVMRIYAPFVVFYGLISFGSCALSAMKRSDISATTVLVRNVIFLSIICVCCMHEMYWVYWGVTVSETIGGVMMLSIAQWYFRKHYLHMHHSDCAGQVPPGTD